MGPTSYLVSAAALEPLRATTMSFVYPLLVLRILALICLALRVFLARLLLAHRKHMPDPDPRLNELHHRVINSWKRRPHLVARCGWIYSLMLLCFEQPHL